MSLIILCEGRGEGGDTFIGLKYSIRVLTHSPLSD